MKIADSPFSSELVWISDWLQHEVFGVAFELVPHDSLARVTVRVPASKGSLSLPLTFLAKASLNWLGTETLPVFPLKYIGLETLPSVTEITDYDSVPVLFGETERKPPLFTQKEERGELNLDIFGSLFFLLSRYEEAVIPDRDAHGRFPAASSVMGKAGLLDRAIGNEYIEILWAAMKRIWPELQRKKREFRVLPSHDIDHPSAYWGLSDMRVLRRCLGLLRRGQLRQGLQYMRGNLACRRGDWHLDPYETIDRIMDLSEAQGLQSSFYYIPEKTDPRLDPGMPLDHAQVEAQWKRIAARGHEIGVHPGYNTFDRPERIQNAADRVRQQLKKLHIRQDVLGGRQHFLRWRTPDTALAWEAAGLDYDSTLAFADRCGFRCGVCYEYPMYDLKNRRPLRLRERPLVVMECTFIDERYMGLGTGEEAFAAMNQLKDECRKYNGDFTVLWHNQRLAIGDEERLYRRVLGFYE